MLKRLLIGLLAFPVVTQAPVREMASPAGPGSGQPNLAVAPDGRAYLSWIERLDEGRFALRFAIKEKDQWSPPRIIAEGSNWFVNWADFPSMIVLPDGSLAAHWLVKSGQGAYDYDVTISQSFDGGKSWGKPLVPYKDGVRAEHGFVSLFATKNGNLAAVWLDGREMKPAAGNHAHGEGSMTLRYVEVKRDGTLTGEAILDTRVCECCQTSAAVTSEGPVVVYRDRSSEEVRDISIVHLRDGRWSSPRSVAVDGWKINGCPVNGPSVAAAGTRVAVAWYTAAGERPTVKVALSGDSGKTFGEATVVDDGKPVGRVEALMLADGSVLVCWLERTSGVAGAEVRVRRIRPDGRKDPSKIVSTTEAARSNGFPQMALSGNDLVFAWTGSRVLTAAMSLP